jgi:hypothetical protein
MSLTKWEYCRKSATAFNEMRIMQEMGEDGWELCAVWIGLLYFKRPLT